MIVGLVLFALLFSGSNCTVKFKTDVSANSIISACTGAAVIDIRDALPRAPIPPDNISSNTTFRIENYPNIEGYRFANPAGIVYDGICARPKLTNNVFEIGPAIKEASWFKGFAWKVLYAKDCVGSSGHLGWSFYKTGETTPSFVFLVLRNSLDNDILETGVWNNNNIVLSAQSQPFTNGGRNRTNSSVINEM